MACLTLVGWEKLQMPGSFQTERGCALSSGYMVAPFAAAIHLLMMKIVKMMCINMKVTTTVRIKFFTFLPENARVPGQQGLQQHWSISLWLIAAQVVLQLSGNLGKLG